MKRVVPILALFLACAEEPVQLPDVGPIVRPPSTPVTLPDTGPPPPTDPPPELPLDNGILLLIIMGLVYGCYVATKRFQTSRTGA